MNAELVDGYNDGCETREAKHEDDGVPIQIGHELIALRYQGKKSAPNDQRDPSVLGNPVERMLGLPRLVQGFLFKVGSRREGQPVEDEEIGAGAIEVAKDLLLMGVDDRLGKTD